MKRLLLVIAIATLTQSASAGATLWPDEALPIPLTHPEFFGGADPSGGENGFLGHHGPNWSSDPGSLLSDNPSPLFGQTSQSQPKDGGSQGDGHDQDHDGPRHQIPTGASDDSLRFGSNGPGDSISADFSISLNGVTLDVTDGDPARNGPALTPEPASLALILSAFLVGAPLWRVRRHEF